LCQGAARGGDKRSTPGRDTRLTVLTAARDGSATASQAGRLSYFGSGSGYWLLRQMILSTRKSEDKIRLTALPESENGVRKVQTERWSAARKECWCNWQRGEPEWPQPKMDRIVLVLVIDVGVSFYGNHECPCRFVLARQDRRRGRKSAQFEGYLTDITPS